jgi:tetratricopeptide (TPR) repeat protein
MNAYDNIEAYIQGDLNEKEVKAFEHALQQDQHLASEYQLRKDIEDALMDEDVLELKDQMQDIIKEKETSPLIWFKRKAVMGALVGALVLSLGSLGYFAARSNQAPTTDQVFEKYYQPYSVTITDRSASAELNSLLTTAMQKYKDREYTQALQLFQQVLEQRDDVAANLYSGISYMEIEKYKKASQSFDKVIQDNDNLYVDQAKWYMSMCYIRLGDIDHARNLLLTLSEQSDYYRDKATEVEKKLRRIEKD